MTKALIIDPSGRPVVSRQRATGITTARYLRGDNLGTLQMRHAFTRDHREDVRAVWSRAGSLAIDVMQNSGRLSGAVDQVLADTIGAELVLTPNPDFTGMGWTKKQREEFIKTVKTRWNRWSRNPIECDLRGKQTIGQMTDAGTRWSIGYGEGTGIIAYLTPEERARRGAQTGTKVCMIQPHRLVQDTNEAEGLYQGVIHDPDGLPIFYRFREKIGGIESKRDYVARDLQGRKLIIHVMDGEPGDVRGLGKFAPALKTWLQYDQLTDATLAQQLIQTIFAATLKSTNLDGDALEGLLQLNDVDQAEDLVENMLGYANAKLDAASENGIDFSTHGRVNSLPAGDSLEFHTPGSTADSYIPLSQNLLRETARCIGITTASLTMDYSEATYSSVRMETSSIWPVVLRRRTRISAPIPQTAYENWLDEQIGEGWIKFKGGYVAFAANRTEVCSATWQGPPKPTADDLKSSKAASERLFNGTSDLEIECADIGVDNDEISERREAQHNRAVGAGLPSPFVRNPGAGEDNEDLEKKEKTPANA